MKAFAVIFAFFWSFHKNISYLNQKEKWCPLEIGHLICWHHRSNFSTHWTMLYSLNIQLEWSNSYVSKKQPKMHRIRMIWSIPYPVLLIENIVSFLSWYAFLASTGYCGSRSAIEIVEFDDGLPVIGQFMDDEIQLSIHVARFCRKVCNRKLWLIFLQNSIQFIQFRRGLLLHGVFIFVMDMEYCICYVHSFSHVPTNPTVRLSFLLIFLVRKPFRSLIHLQNSSSLLLFLI